MAIYRNVSMSFWTDSKISDDFSPEERYFYLYLFTNPHSNLCGCYEISLKQMAYETGYPVKKVEEIIKSLFTKHNVIRYDTKTKEILILNWHKYNWTTSERFRKPLAKEIKVVKNEIFRDYLQRLFDGEEPKLDTVSDFADTVYENADTVYEVVNNSDTPIDTSVSVSVSVSDTVSDTVSVTDTVKDSIKEIIDYFNEITGKHYTYTGKETVEHIRARLRDGFTVDDFKTVIYKKTREWKGTRFEKFIRPQTLFSTNFESYLNQTESLDCTQQFDAMLEEWASDG